MHRRICVGGCRNQRGIDHCVRPPRRRTPVNVVARETARAIRPAQAYGIRGRNPGAGERNSRRRIACRAHDRNTSRQASLTGWREDHRKAGALACAQAYWQRYPAYAECRARGGDLRNANRGISRIRDRHRLTAAGASHGLVSKTERSWACRKLQGLCQSRPRQCHARG